MNKPSAKATGAPHKATKPASGTALAPAPSASPAARLGPVIAASTSSPAPVIQTPSPILEDGRRLTGKQEAFALAVAKGATLAAAYRHAYDCETMLPATVHGNAGTLAKDSRIAARIDTLITEININTLHDPKAIREMVLTNLQRLANDPATPHAVKARCNELLGKVRGVDLFTAGAGEAEGRATKADMRALGDRLSKLIPQSVDIIEASPFRPKDDGPDQGKA